MLTSCNTSCCAKHKNYRYVVEPLIIPKIKKLFGKSERSKMYGQTKKKNLELVWSSIYFIYFSNDLARSIVLLMFFKKSVYHSFEVDWASRNTAFRKTGFNYKVLPGE